MKGLLNLTHKQAQGRSSPPEEHREGTTDAGRKTWATPEKMVEHSQRGCEML